VLGQNRKRFWKEVTVIDGFTVQLDARPLRTPGKVALVMPTRSMAEAVAAEWRLVEGMVNPEVMPVTRAANAAIDKVSVQHDEVAANLAGYAGTDLLCYRAPSPERLRARQDAAWDVWLEWVADTHDAPLRVYTGVLAGPQEQASLDRLAAAVARFDAFELTALYDLVAISGSLVLGLAVAAGAIGGNAAFDVSRIDEIWQAELWGFDEEAEAIVALKRQSFLNAERFLQLARN
jgi:chaperone required for assembly of F1-ATPase